MQDSITKFKSIVIANFSREDFQYHEWMVEYHLKIVERIAMELCDIYPDADRDVVQALVWFHDFGKPLCGDDADGEKEITERDGPKALRECGFSEEIIHKVLENWRLMEKKNEMDLRSAPIEAQIISSADGASHFVGVFYPSYFRDGFDFPTTQKRLREKMQKDWERKIVLPEAKDAFAKRFERAREMIGDFPEKFL